MKFSDDYLSTLFGHRVFDVLIEFRDPYDIGMRYDYATGKTSSFIKSKGLISVKLMFRSFNNDLPIVKGSLYKIYQKSLSSNLTEYIYECIGGKETGELFRHALGAKA